jgi:enoyl-CoA hydratase/carnithine racemase
MRKNVANKVAKPFFTKLQIWREEHVGIIALNNFSQNFLDEELVDQLSSALTIAEGDERIKVLCITGSGPTFFSAGVRWERIEDLKGFIQKTHALASILLALSKPTVSLVNSHALGAGFELSLLTDFRLSAQGAKLGFPEGRLGYPTVFASFYILNKIVGPSVAKKILTLGEMFDSQTALQLGLVDMVFEKTNFYGDAKTWVSSLANSSKILSATRQVALNPLEFRRALDLEMIYAMEISEKFKEEGLSELRKAREKVALSGEKNG